MLKPVAIILIYSVMVECGRNDFCEYVPANCGIEVFDIMHSLDNFPTEEFLNENCSLLLEQMNCHKDFVDGCAKVIGPLNYFTIFEGMLTAFTDACDQNSTLRSEYLQNVACYTSTVSKLDACVTGIQSKTDLFEEWEKNTTLVSENIERRKYGCISGPLRRRCFTSVIVKECGEEAAEIFAGIIHTVSHRVTMLMCSDDVVDVWKAEFSSFLKDHALDLPER